MQSICLVRRKPWVPFLELHRLGMVVPAYNASTRVVEVGGSEVQGFPMLHT